MAKTYDCSVDSELLTGMRLARAALGRGELVVLPTDTVYGIAADAFTPDAVAALLAAKGRDRQSPPPVLIPGLPTLDALAEAVPDVIRDLLGAFWPGGLTVVLPAQPSLAWDLGETRGTVALRMPNDPITLELLEETGPLAVSSANLTGRPAAGTAQEAQEMLGDSVAVYLDAGPRPAFRPSDAPPERASTIVDATAVVAGTGVLRILRHGAITDEEIRDVVGEELLPLDADAEPDAGAAADDAGTEGDAAPADADLPAQADGDAAPEADAPAEEVAVAAADSDDADPTARDEDTADS